MNMDLHPNHHPQPLQQRPPPPPPPPQPSHKPLHEQELKGGRPIIPLSFANGALKKHRPLYPALLAPNHVVYRECMKNHAASLGGHALDGCGEFMPSPDATPADPASLTCAACGCHRNFHRRLLHGGDHPLPAHHPHREEIREVPDDAAAEEDDGDEAVEDDDNDEDARAATPPPPPPLATAGHQYYSAPHMLMALSAGIPGVAPGSAPAAVAAQGSVAQLPRKRFRTKFSALQKEKMQELSKRLGWRMQRRDEALVEECCREIGVSRGVFKVWMHNNKHNFVSGPSSRRAASAGGGHVAAGGAVVGGIGGMGVSRGETTSSSGGGLIVAGGVPTGMNGVDERNGVGVKLNGGGNGEHALNSSSPSS